MPPVIHVYGWIAALVISFLQPWGKVAADTKHDLVANPQGFLAGALNAYSDTFPLGQMQNQAYGYLFPQGFFFLITDPLPDWIAQRLWWTLLLGLGFSGFLLLAQRFNVGNPTARVIAAALWALSPRTLTTIGAISSEAWPIMLAPWALWPLVRPKHQPPQVHHVALSVLAVASMGAVNATATAAACIPAGLWLVYRRHFMALGYWLLGCALVSAWWIIPLLVLGKYASPFTDYIESATVTTNWLNVAEILRGTTSWAPFVEHERLAGNLLVSNPYFILFTLGVAALGLCGLLRLHRYWLFLLALGLLVLGGAHHVVGFLDGPGVALRNVHKFDLLVRLPLMMGVAAAIATVPAWTDRARRASAMALIVLLAAGATAPAWSGRLLPQGAYTHVPDYWGDAADYINAHAANTRTLIWPPTHFARQTWGWTRDEPAQPLLDVPWVVRDAVPLVDPEAIRSLDGLSQRFSLANLERMGVGAVMVRHDLAVGGRSTASLFPDTDYVSFGEVDVVLLNPQRSMLLTDTTDLPTVAGGGEVLNLLGPGTFSLVDHNAQIVTDTPALTGRNYGELHSVSAQLANPDEASDVTNPVIDYPSRGPLTTVTGQGHATASSSAADSSSFGGANPAQSITAAVDGNTRTAWYPTPGPQAGQWLELAPDVTAETNIVDILTTGDAAELTFSSGDATVTRFIEPGEKTSIRVPGPGTQPVRITLGASEKPVGIAEVSIQDRPVTRIVTVPDTSPGVQQFLFQRVFTDTDTIIRSFTAPRTMTVRVDPSTCYPRVRIDGEWYSCGDHLTLEKGQHELRTNVNWVTLTVPGFNAGGASTTTLTRSGDGGVAGEVSIAPADHDRILVTTRATNPGLTAIINNDSESWELEPITVNAGSQGFIIPAGLEGTFRMDFAGNAAYRAGLIAGGGVAVLTALALTVLCIRRRHQFTTHSTGGEALGPTPATSLAIVVALTTAGTGGGIIIALGAAIAAWAILRYTLIPRTVLTTALILTAGAWLARAPWPDGSYAGNTLLLHAVCALAICAATITTQWRKRQPPTKK